MNAAEHLHDAVGHYRNLHSQVIEHADAEYKRRKMEGTTNEPAPIHVVVVPTPTR